MNAEQTSKLRPIVKAKLIETGEYINDKLLDYVMIMVKNKKSEQQMTDDLELFLGGQEKAADFSSWLHKTVRNTDEESNESSAEILDETQTQESESLISNLSKTCDQSSLNKNKRKLSMSDENLNASETEELAIQIENNEFMDEVYSNDDENLNKRPKSSLSENEADKKDQQDGAKSSPTASASADLSRSVMSCEDPMTNKTHSTNNRPIGQNSNQIKNYKRKFLKTNSRKPNNLILIKTTDELNLDKSYEPIMKQSRITYNDYNDLFTQEQAITHMSEYDLENRTTNMIHEEPIPRRIVQLESDGQFVKHNTNSINFTCRYDGSCTKADCPYKHFITRNKQSVDTVTHSVYEQPTTAVSSVSLTNSNEDAKMANLSSSPSRTPLSAQANGPFNSSPATNAALKMPSFAYAPPHIYYNPPVLPLHHHQVFMPAVNQYTLINRSNSQPSIPVNCKYGALCKNPKCIYTHVNLPQKSQLKWVSPSLATKLQQSNSTASTEKTVSDDVPSVVNGPAEPTTINSSEAEVISESTMNEPEQYTENSASEQATVEQTHPQIDVNKQDNEQPAITSAQ